MIPFDHLARAHAKIYWESRGNNSLQEQGQSVEQVGLREKAMAQAQKEWKEELLKSGARTKRVVAAILPCWDEWMARGGPGHVNV